jgi:hypothetical protein
MSAPALSSFNIITAAADRVGRLEARMVLLPREVMAVAAEPDAQPEEAAAVVAAAEPDAQPEVAAAVVVEPVAQREVVAAVVVAEPVAQPVAAVAAVQGAQRREGVMAAAQSGLRQAAPSVEAAEVTAVRLWFRGRSASAPGSA